MLAEVDVTAVSGPTDAEVTAVSVDSRRVRPGTLFFGVAGTRDDGARYAEQAMASGAVGVVVARGTAFASRARASAIVEVEEPRRALAQAAARLHGHPERALRVVGVTGTNGKTTTTWMLESILRAAGITAGVIGTTGVALGGERRAASLTTPDAPELFALLREMVDRGVQVVAIEVSSHALAQRRAYGIGCEVAVFTNLTRDHLDYHETMERYFDAKLMLFDGRNGARRDGAVAVVNANDPNADAVARAAERGGLSVLRYAVATAGDGLPVVDADLAVLKIETTPGGLDLEVVLDPRPRSEFHATVPLIGRHNAWNAAAAMTAAHALGIASETSALGLASMPQVPGRLERVDAGQPFLVVVDYAHTPDALERALAAAREHATGRVLLVFGAGGDRDRGKRAPMGAVAARLADHAWVTNDNPRGEDPRTIADEILSGAGVAAPGPAERRRATITVELDRRRAIAAALAVARAGDVVLIAGKGHETTQTIGTAVTPFDDRLVTREALAAIARSGGARS
ncbi:MAG: UDP-N-acetylmuramoyl-L-alanyl-D-glutamate--2,6-diaminopimelate ligase [Candidatus Eisenbacteria bacterium]|nr:UDP-N-acetylmuramoyl-L-alanyl-D-glutamate--2,6-diaminopimelate ligase [Candidatus Eisenbacteria bacterium]